MYKLVIGGLIVFLVVFSFPFVLNVMGGRISDKIPEPEIKLPKGRCLKERNVMRASHMNLLKEARDKVVREGIRGSFTLTSCRECHKNRDEFCNRCHNFVGAKPLCFSCHYYP
ncbi:MAG: hypothetical protein AB1595_02625 [bacterium]